MKVLVIKTSSMGDILHTLPALTDASRAVPDIRFDWLVEEAFAEIPGWHPAVDQVIPVAIRRWRKTPLKTLTGPEWQTFRSRLKSTRYDLAISILLTVFGRMDYWYTIDIFFHLHGRTLSFCRQRYGMEIQT